MTWYNPASVWSQAITSWQSSRGIHIIVPKIFSQTGTVIGGNTVWQWQLALVTSRKWHTKPETRVQPPCVTSVTYLGALAWAESSPSLPSPRWRLYNNLTFSAWACQNNRWREASLAKAIYCWWQVQYVTFLECDIFLRSKDMVVSAQQTWCCQKRYKVTSGELLQQTSTR